MVELEVVQVQAEPDEQWLRRQISAYFESEHELTLDGKTLCFAIATCCWSVCRLQTVACTTALQQLYSFLTC